MRCTEFIDDFFNMLPILPLPLLTHLFSLCTFDAGWWSAKIRGEWARRAARTTPADRQNNWSGEIWPDIFDNFFSCPHSYSYLCSLICCHHLLLAQTDRESKEEETGQGGPLVWPLASFLAWPSAWPLAWRSICILYASWYKPSIAW